MRNVPILGVWVSRYASSGAAALAPTGFAVGAGQDHDLPCDDAASRRLE
jgi:hypothetical protein